MYLYLYYVYIDIYMYAQTQATHANTYMLYIFLHLHSDVHFVSWGRKQEQTIRDPADSAFHFQIQCPWTLNCQDLICFH